MESSEQRTRSKEAVECIHKLKNLLGQEVYFLVNSQAPQGLATQFVPAEDVVEFLCKQHGLTNSGETIN